jgi:hypothetical protein
MLPFDTANSTADAVVSHSSTHTHTLAVALLLFLFLFCFVTAGEFMNLQACLNFWRRSFAWYILFPSAEKWNAKSVTALGHEQSTMLLISEIVHCKICPLRTKACGAGWYQ